jgi:hypothetical protein
MILDKSRLSIADTSQSRAYVYDFPSDDKKINIFLFAITGDGQIKYMVSKAVNDLDGNQIVSSDDTIFETNDLKAAWEKFEDFFEETQKEENPQQGGEEPEVQTLCMSVNKNGHSYVFLQKEDGTQELLFELDIDNYDIINTKPKFASLDFTGNSAMQEPFNTQWALGLVDNITFADAQVDSTTYIVALKSIDQPGQNEPSQEGEDKKGEKEPGDDKGEPSDKPGDDKGKPTDKPGDDKGKPTDEPGDDKGKPIDEPGDNPWPQPKPTDEPGDNPWPQPKPGDDPGDNPWPQPQPKPGDDEDKKPIEYGDDKVTTVEFSSAVKEIADKTGISPDNIEAALRTERTFDTFLTLQKVNVNELKDKLNAGTLTRNQFIKQVVNDFKKI